MATHRIALLPGDGVGPEVVAATRRVLEAAAAIIPALELNFSEYPVGQAAYRQFGSALPAEAMTGIRGSDAAFLGALAAGAVPGPSPMGLLRRTLDLYADVRPIRSLPGVWCLRDDIDLVFIRENTEGFLADRNLHRGYGEFMPDENVVMSLRVLTRQGCERIARYAFEYACRHARRKITVAHKANVLREGCGFFLDITRQVARDYPHVDLTDEFVDNVAHNLVACPQHYDVILTTNLFGDILSDEGAGLVSNLAPSANIGPSCAVFRPVHEALSGLAGRDIVNPLPSVLSGALMLRHLGEDAAAEAVEQAVMAVLSDGGVTGGSPDACTGTTSVTGRLCAWIAGRG
jgi:isocitrate/isopropylmalate dehydrogenase